MRRLTWQLSVGCRNYDSPRLCEEASRGLCRDLYEAALQLSGAAAAFCYVDFGRLYKIERRQHVAERKRTYALIQHASLLLY